MKNLILIGMPGAGKSTAGVILAKTLGMHFTDTDIMIQQRSGRLLQEILDTEGPEVFKRIEEEAVLSHTFRDAVVATGGSVVYSKRAMEHVRKDGIVVYLRIPFAEMERRLCNITTRGIVLSKGQTLREMYDKRIPLYEKYADITVDCDRAGMEAVVRMIVDKLARIPR